MNIRENILENRLREAKLAYYNQSPIMSDAAFDVLENELRAINPQNPVLAETGAPANVNSHWPVARHATVMASLSKAQDRDGHTAMDEAADWWTTNRVTSAYLSEKQDGLSLALVYDEGKLVRATVRGDGVLGDVITVNALKMNGVLPVIDVQFPVEVRGEIRMKRSSLEEARRIRPAKGYANTRNTASGLAREKSGELCHLLDFVAWDVLGTSLESEVEKFAWLAGKGFSFTPGCEVTSIGKAREIYQLYHDSRRASLDYDIDGLVLRVNDEETFFRGGVNSENKPKLSIAVKFPPRVVQTTIRNIRWECSDAGKFCPVAEVDPVECDGATVRNCSLYNADFLLLHEVTIGAEIELQRAGEIIPELVRVVKPGLPFWKVS